MNLRLEDHAQGNLVWSLHLVEPAAAHLLGPIGLAIDTGSARVTAYFTPQELDELIRWLVGGLELELAAHDAALLDAGLDPQ